VETVYGISIASDLDQDRLGRRLPASALTWFHRLVLHREIAFAPGKAVFVGTAISHRGMNKISVRWRGRRSPFQRGRFPWVIVHLFAVFDAPKEINNEGDLGEAHDPGRP